MRSGEAVSSGSILHLQRAIRLLICGLDCKSRCPGMVGNRVLDRSAGPSAHILPDWMAFSLVFQLRVAVRRRHGETGTGQSHALQHLWGRT